MTPIQCDPAGKRALGRRLRVVQSICGVTCRRHLPKRVLGDQFDETCRGIRRNPSEHVERRLAPYRRHHRRTLVVLRSIAAARSQSRSQASKRRTIRSRPIRVSHASLCMFAEPSGERVGGFATPSFTRYGSVNNLFINYS